MASLLRYFVNPAKKGHAKFGQVGAMVVSLHTAQDQLAAKPARSTTIGDAVADGPPHTPHPAPHRTALHCTALHAPPRPRMDKIFATLDPLPGG